MKWLPVLAASLLVLSGCVTRTEFVCPQTSLPLRPLLPILSVEQELSLENDVYVLLATRERLLQSHVALLEELITENNSCE